jgi:cyanophycin synthetase
MKILSTNVYVGPNLYANFPVIRHIIDIGILEGWPSVKLGEGFINGLIEALPGIEKHGCSYGTEGGFVKRLREDEGTWIGHIWEHVTLEIQTVAGSDTSFGRTRSEGKPGIYRMVFEYHQREVGLEAALLARRLLISLLPEHIQNQLEVKIDDDFDFQEQLVRFIKFAQSKEFGPSTGALVKAATKRGIPYMRLNEGSLVQFGHGKYQKRIQATVTSQTTQIAVDIACDKE